MTKKKAIVIILTLVFITLGLNIAWARTNDISLNSDIVIEADRVNGFRDGIAAIHVYGDDGAFYLGYVDYNGMFVLPLRRYTSDFSTPEFSYGLVSVFSVEDGALGFFDVTGEAVTPFIFDSARGFSEGLAAVSYEGEWGFIDVFGNMVIPFMYELAGDFSEGVAPVKLNGRWGFVDTSAELVIPFVLEDYPDADFIHPGFSYGLVPVIVSGEDGIRWGYLNRMGNRIYTYLYTSANGFNDGLALVTRIDAAGNAVYGFINQAGEEIVPPVYDLARDFSEGLGAVMFNDGWGFVDQYGRVQIPVRYDYARSFSNGFAAVQNDGLWGFIDRWGNEVVPLIYDEVGDFSYSFAPVRQGDLWGYVYRDGNIVSGSMIFLEATRFSENRAWVRQADGWNIVESYQYNGMTYVDEVRYIYQPLGEYRRFIPDPHVLTGIYDMQSAEDALRYTTSHLTPDQRASGYAINNITLFMENIIRRGTTQALPEDGVLFSDILESSAYNGQNLWQTALATTNSDNVYLMRQLRIGINFIAPNKDTIRIVFPDDVSGIGFDYITVEAAFASLTIQREDIIAGSLIYLERGGSTRIPEPVLMGFIIQDFLSNPVDYLLEYWAVVAIILLIIVWGTLASFGHRFRLWVVPTFALLFVLGNIWTLHSGRASTDEYEEYEEPPVVSEGYVDSIIITMPSEMKATVSFPLSNANPQRLVILCEQGLPQLSKYNPATGSIDARITHSSTYSLAARDNNFVDIGGTDPIVQDAILSLAIMGIMHGDGEYFHPDSAITRGELAAALVTILDLSTHTTNIFPDNDPDDLHYHAVTTVAYHGLINGFGDGNFRGDWAVPKSDLVVVIGRVLMDHLEYWPPPVDAGVVLARYQDRDRIDMRAQDNIALVAVTGILAEREDGRFAPEGVMTRGDAAVVIYRLWGRVWS